MSISLFPTISLWYVSVLIIKSTLQLTNICNKISFFCISWAAVVGSTWIFTGGNHIYFCSYYHIFAFPKAISLTFNWLKKERRICWEYHSPYLTRITIWMHYFIIIHLEYLSHLPIRIFIVYNALHVSLAQFNTNSTS